MEQFIGLVAVVLTFVVILVIIHNIHQLLMKKKGDSTVVNKAKAFAEKKKAKKDDPSDMSREDLLREMARLNERIENMDIILKERNKNGN
jgi:hypothetical protein